MEREEYINRDLDKNPTQVQHSLSMAEKIRIMMAIKLSTTDNIPAEILPGVYIGSIGAAMSFNVLKSLGITHVLCVADSIKPIFPNDFTYKIVEICDSPDVSITDRFADCFKFIESAVCCGKILIHWYEIFSFAGKSRSASVCIGYIMIVSNCAYEQAYAYLKKRRPAIEPNPGFVQQLNKFNPSSFCGRNY